MARSDSSLLKCDSSAITCDVFDGTLDAYPTLPYEPDNAMELEITPRVNVARFGDGYEQRVEAGINNSLQRWSVTYDTKGQLMAESVFNFFKALRGANAFLWTPPGEYAPRRFVARSYKRSLPYGSRVIQTVTTVFEEVMA